MPHDSSQKIDRGVAPNQIIVAGDSAGGNISLGLLSHVMYPHPSIPSLNLSEDLKGLILLSPWVTFDQTAPAMSQNANKDMLEKSVLKRWSDAFMGGAEDDNYNTPLMADGDWWKGLPAKEVLILAGRDELFVSDIEEFVKKLNVSVEKKEENGPPVSTPHTRLTCVRTDPQRIQDGCAGSRG